jgi:chemotaxis protein CheC
MDELKMTDKEKDALSEAGNIAAGYAVSALSELLGEDIMIDVTKCQFVNINKITEAFDNPKNFVVGLNMLIPTTNLCSVLMFLPYKSAMEYCDKFAKNKIGTTKEISYKEYVFLAEIGTISLCAYLNALSKLLNITLLPTPPAVACDVMSSILEDVAPSAETFNDNAILIETNFEHKSSENKGNILFIPDGESKDAIFKAFKVNHNGW